MSYASIGPEIDESQRIAGVVLFFRIIHRVRGIGAFHKSEPSTEGLSFCAYVAWETCMDVE